MPFVVAASNPAVTAIGGALVVLGLLLFVVTIRLWRAAAIDPEVLAPLEVMSSRRYMNADDASRSRILNEVRHPGAVKIERLVLEPERKREKRRHRRSIDEIEAEHQAHHLDVPVARTDDSREIDIRPSPQPEPEPIAWGGITPRFGDNPDFDEPTRRPSRRGRRREAARPEPFLDDVRDEGVRYVDSHDVDGSRSDVDDDSGHHSFLDPLIHPRREWQDRRSRGHDDDSSWGDYE